MPSQVRRLELICRKALSDSLTAANVVPLLEASHTTEDQCLFAQCRRYMAENIVAVKRSGGVEQFRDLGVTKGVLSDAIDAIASLQQKLAAAPAQ